MIEIGLFEGMSIFSQAIKLATWGKYSHSGILFNRTWLYESWRKGVEKNKLEDSHHTKGTPIDLYKFTVPIDEQAIIDYLKSQLGKKYDFMGIVGQASHTKTQDKNKLFCSEYTSEAADKGGAKLFNCPYYKISPTLQSWSTVLKPTDRIYI